MINHPNRRKASKASIAASTANHDHEYDYSALLSSVRASFARAVAGNEPLFTTDAAGLNDLYLDKLPSERQVHTCHCCRRFIGTYGNLVKVGADGSLIPVMWDPTGVPDFYRPAFEALTNRVRKARIESVFLSKEAVWGTPETGSWSHLSVVSPAVYRERALTASQAMAAVKENYRTVATALGEFTAPMLDEAMRLFTAETLSRSEKFIGPVKWLRGLHDRPKGRLGENLLWRAIALAPEGYCHPKASVIGPLLDDIAAGMPFSLIKQRFDAKLAPLAYQRPQAPPSAGNIKAAEALVEKLGIARSLERRFARPDEVQVLWRPGDPRGRRPPSAGGVFGHLKPKPDDGIRPVNMPTVTMTWDKFARTVLPSAERIELLVPYSGRFIALTAAAHADAPPIIKWDRDDERNPVAWYVYPNGSPASQWGLTAGWTRVTALTQFPNQWGGRPMPHMADGVVMLLDSACDTRRESGNALFPEMLREELHGARSTIEAYSRKAVLDGYGEPAACGYEIRKGSDCTSTLRVLSSGAWTSYRIDRWD